MNENNEVTPEQYRVEVLKSRFANKLAQAEDEISHLITQVAQLEQQLQQQTQDVDEGEVKNDEMVPEKEDSATG